MTQARQTTAAPTPADDAGDNRAAPDIVHALRSRWMPHKERLRAERGDHPTNIRFHRACSWLAKADQAGQAGDLDAALVYRWTALNSFYGRWDEAKRQPENDRESYRAFLDRVRKLDAGERIVGVLQDEKRLVFVIVEDRYLGQYFWRNPDPALGRRPDRERFRVQSAYVEGGWARILDAVVERVYLLRCQLVHGAATSGGRLNRDAVRRCGQMLGHLAPAVLEVVVDHGADEDWGTMCYPPMR